MKLNFPKVKKFIEANLRHRQIEMSQIELVALEAAWKSITYEKMGNEAGVNLIALSTHDGPKFWRTLSHVFGRKITKPSFRRVITEIIEKQGLALVNSKPTGKTILGTKLPLSEDFFGRKQELKQIKEFIEKYGFTLIIGAAGIGKRSLVAEIVNAWDFEMRRIIWKPLHHRPSAQQLETELKSLLKLKRSQQLIEFFKEESYLIVFESLDATLIQQGNSRHLDPQYLSLIRRICEESPARIVATSKEPIPEIKTLELRGQAVMHTLRGLKPEAAKRMVGEHLDIDIEEICRATGGNPLMLRLMDRWLQETGSQLGSSIVNRLTVQASVVDDVYQTLINDTGQLSTIDKHLLNTISEHENGIPFSKLITENPTATSNVQRLIEMGVITKDWRDDTVHIDALFRQFLVKNPNPAMSA